MNNHDSLFKINETDITENAGKILAVDMQTGYILAVRSDMEILQHAMRTAYPDVKYAQIILPKE